MQIGIEPKNDGFALKVLQKEQADIADAYAHEVAQLNSYESSANLHLVKLLASFTYKDKYYMLFPRANCSLEVYWQRQSQPPIWDLETVIWISQQCKGLVEAMDEIHTPRENITRSQNEKIFGIHGDVKPHNILLFGTLTPTRGTLVLADMGNSVWYTAQNRSKDLGRGGDYTYEALEVSYGFSSISEASDVWSLGCVFLEMMTWLLGGFSKLEEFRRIRKAEEVPGRYTRNFHLI